MRQIGLVLLFAGVFACKHKDKPAKDDALPGFQYDSFAAGFKAGTLPYSLTDAGLLNKTTATTLPSDMVASFLSDSIKKTFGKGSIKYTPLVKFQTKEKETYFIIKAATAAKTGAFLLVFDKAKNFAAQLPFLLPDNDDVTTQTTNLDKSFAVSKNVVQKKGGDVLGEGKEVSAYDAKEKKFSLIMTDILNDNSGVLVNPIDTFKATTKWTGDYYLNKKNMVAIRDGRHPNQVLVYVHTENEDGTCRGELKGEALMTTAATAAYRQGGDPCVLALTFAGNTVSIKEERGCGNHRDLDCPLAGVFTKKKNQKIKEAAKKKK